VGREVEVPCEAMDAAKNDTEDGEDDHAGVFIAFGAWSVERRNVSSTRRNFVGGNDLEGGCKDEGGNEEKDEERAEDHEDEDEKKETGRNKEEPSKVKGKHAIVVVYVKVVNIFQWPIRASKILANGICQIVAQLPKVMYDSGCNRFIVLRLFHFLRFDSPEKNQDAQREK
jgi:hypothetical protein